MLWGLSELPSAQGFFLHGESLAGLPRGMTHQSVGAPESSSPKFLILRLVPSEPPA